MSARTGGRLPYAERQAPAARLRGAALCFGTGPTTTRAALPRGRLVGQAQREFAAPAPNGLALEARNAGEFAVAGLGRVGGERAHVPTALGFGEATEQQVDLVVALGQRRIGTSLARMTFALMNTAFHLRAP